ncbi:MAG TPA: DUF1295 domain-containing protein [Spirochaetia bacterium]|nr:DUF1295 domain-containing protein [Spirochaetia bacterium]
MIYADSGKSIPQRLLVQLLETVLLAVAIFLVFRVDGNPVRHMLLVSCFIVVYLRLTVTIFYLLKRSMGWKEAISIPFAFALYYLGFALLGRGSMNPIGGMEAVGTALFVIGSAVNTLSELLRNRWKKNPENRGKLYTGGLFKYSMHVNYFGDLVWVLGLALITSNWWSLLIPALLFCFFAFYNAPMLDRHLAEKYGEEFTRYQARTARIVPFIF